MSYVTEICAGERTSVRLIGDDVMITFDGGVRLAVPVDVMQNLLTELRPITRDISNAALAIALAEEA